MDIIQSRRKIRDLSVYIGFVNDIYQAYSAEGSNKGLAVLESIADEYDALADVYDDADQCFFAVIDALMEKIDKDNDSARIPLEMCGLWASVRANMVPISMLQDKLPRNTDCSDYIILSLSQNDKLFRIERH